MEGGRTRDEDAICLCQRCLLLGGQRGLKLGQSIADLQHLQVFCAAHLGMLDIHAIVHKQPIHSPSSPRVPSR